MSNEERPLTPGEWDAWRDNPLTRKCVAMIVTQYNERIGALADHEIKENYGAVFADPWRQARYASLRGMLRSLKEVQIALDWTLQEFLNDEKESDEKD